MRYVLVDRFEEVARGRRAVALKCVTHGEPFLRGLEAYPGALVLEALLQTGGMLARAGTGHRRATVLGRVNRAAFPAEAQAGDRIRLEVDQVMARPEGIVCEGVARVGDRVVARAEFMLVYLPEELAPPVDAETVERRRLLMRALGVQGEDS